MHKTDRIVAFCDVPEGRTKDELAAELQASKRNLAPVVSYLARVERIYTAVTPEHAHHRRHFTRKEHRDAWQAANPVPPAEVRAKLKIKRSNDKRRVSDRRPMEPKDMPASVPGSICHDVYSQLSDEPITTKDIMKRLGVGDTSVNKSLSRLRVAGMAFFARVHFLPVFFSTEAARDAYVARESLIRKQQKRQRDADWEKRRRRRQRVEAKKPGAVKAPAFAPTKDALPAPVHIKRQEPKPTPAQEIDYSKAKITICPSPPTWAKTGVDPSKPVEGGFRAAGVGRYLEAA